MPHTVSTALQTEIDKDQLIYTEIYNVALSGTTLYLTPTPPTVSGSSTAFTLGSQPYQSFAITRSAVKSSSDGTVDGISVRFQNADLAMGAIVLDQDIRGALVTISGLALSSGTNQPISADANDYRHVFHGTIGAIKLDEEFVELQLNFPIKDIRRDVPRRFYSQPLFPFILPRA